MAPSDQGLLILSSDDPDGTRMSELPSVKRNSHLEESDSIHLASSGPGGTKGLKGRETEKLKETEGAERVRTKEEVRDREIRVQRRGEKRKVTGPGEQTETERGRQTDKERWRQTDSAGVSGRRGRQRGPSCVFNWSGLFETPHPQKKSLGGGRRRPERAEAPPDPLRPGSLPPRGVPPSLPARSLTCQRQDLGLVEQQRAPVAGGARGALGPGAQLLRAPVHGVHLLVVKIQPRAGAEVAHARHWQRVADVVLQEPHKGVHGGRRGRAPVGPVSPRGGRGGGDPAGGASRAAGPGGGGRLPGTRAPPTVIVPESTALPIGCSRLGAEKGGGRGRGAGEGGLETHRHSQSQTRAITAGARFA